MLQAILSSKLYRNSPRKDKIAAAFGNPINAELVGQLAKALDEEYQTPELLTGEPLESKQETSQESTTNAPESDEGFEEGTSSPSFFSHPSGSSSSSSSNSSESSEDTGDSNSTDTSSEPSADTSSSEGSTSNSEGAGVVEESIKIKGTPITSSLHRNIFKDMRQVADEIKGMLNFKDSTHGVNRILCKEHELWIYYNDDVNLNNVMADVIETLNAASYTYLEFNRLARSDNAIVFLIEFPDSQNLMKADPANQKK